MQINRSTVFLGYEEAFHVLLDVSHQVLTLLDHQTLVHVFDADQNPRQIGLHDFVKLPARLLRVYERLL